MTRASASTSPPAIILPMPREPPVTSAVLPETSKRSLGTRACYATDCLLAGASGAPVAPTDGRPGKRRWGREGSGATAPAQNLYDTTIPRQKPSPAVLYMKSMVNTTGLDAGADVDVLCSI